MENIFWQECNNCGAEFRLKYNKNHTYDYIDDSCDCHDSFSPQSGEPSISQWLEQQS